VVAQLVETPGYNPEGMGSIPEGVPGIFHWLNPSGRTVALGSTPPLTEISSRVISLGSKGDRCLGLATFHTLMNKVEP
jgi:hypothetical protein